MTEIVRVVGKARRALTNAITDMESRLQSYSGEVLGDIEAKLDALTREEICFCKRIQDIRSTFTSDFEQEFLALVYRLKLEPEDHLSHIYQIFNNLHHQESQLYLVQHERVSAKIAQALVQWDVKNKEVKVSRSAEDQGSLTVDRTQEAMNQMTGRMLDAQMGRISWSLWNKKFFNEKEKLV